MTKHLVFYTLYHSNGDGTREGYDVTIFAVNRAEFKSAVDKPGITLITKASELSCSTKDMVYFDGDAKEKKFDFEHMAILAMQKHNMSTANDIHLWLLKHGLRGSVGHLSKRYDKYVCSITNLD